MGQLAKQVKSRAINRLNEKSPSFQPRLVNYANVGPGCTILVVHVLWLSFLEAVYLTTSNYNKHHYISLC